MEQPERTERDTAQSRTIQLLRERVEAVTAQRNRLRDTIEQLRAQIERHREQGERHRAERDALRQAVAKAEQAGQEEATGPSAAEGLVKDLAAGRPLLTAAVAYTRSALREKERLQARAFAHGLMDQPATATIGTLCSAIHAHSDGFRPLAARLFAQLDPALVREHAPVEHLDTLLETAPAEALGILHRLLADPAALGAHHWLGIARAVASRGRFDLAMPAVASAVARRDELASDDERLRADWLHGELARRGAEPRQLPVDQPRLAVIDYKLPDYDRASSNLGDWVQTLACLSNVVRFTGVEFTSADGVLGEWLNRQRDRVQAEYRIPAPTGRLAIDVMDRDSSSSRTYDRPTWLIAFGWYMHPSFKAHFDFPFAANLRPLFISFHINNRALLDADGAAYLRRHQPIGCRDWTTVYLLREYGVEAFFSGCVTTTVGKLFAPPQRYPAARRRTALVEYRQEAGEFDGDEVTRFSHATTDVRHNGLVANLDQVVGLLDTYQGYDRIATSRLHCYLPCRSMGLDVKFKPRSMSDIRFEGLAGLDQEAYAAMRSGIEHKLAAVMERIIAGADEATVYATWRELCRPDVARADAYCRTYPPLPPPSFDVAAVAGGLRAGSLRTPLAGDDGRPHIEVAFAVDHNLAEELPVVLESATANCSGRLRIHVLTRGLPRAYWDRLARDFAGRADFAFYDCDRIDYGSNLRMLAHTTVSTMDRLLLPDLLPDLAKVIYLDVDILVLGDLAELWAIDLGGKRLAGKSSTFQAWRYGYGMAYRAAATLPHEKAWELRRRLHDQGPLVFNACNAGVLVMNLERMRAEDFANRHVPLIESCAMNDQDALNMYARTDRLELGTQWNAVPSQDVTEGAKILHFAGAVKPWTAQHITRKEDFLAWRRRYLARTAAAAADG